MKFLILFGLFFVISSTKSMTKDEIVKSREECIKELEIPDELLQQYALNQFPDDPKTRCYFHCYHSKLHVFNDEHGYDYDYIVKNTKFSDEFLQDFKICMDNLENRDEDRCKWAYKTYNCILKQHPDAIRNYMKTLN
uniref:Putative pbp/gobp family n=1 Tax=Corethrella appendiculata TaxID=1370023 RepID=U5ETH6_9DIPT